jgi:hypothetical protein
MKLLRFRGKTMSQSRAAIAVNESNARHLRAMCHIAERFAHSMSR